jgi:hypothetical protein
LPARTSDLSASFPKKRPKGTRWGEEEKVAATKSTPDFVAVTFFPFFFPYLPWLSPIAPRLTRLFETRPVDLRVLHKETHLSHVGDPRTLHDGKRLEVRQFRAVF